jgi:ABC-type multidrug transport system permease subunit
MRALKKIASTGRAVCATIHQPSSAVFEMFDDLLLLKQGGEAVFFGELGQESCHLVDYFEARGAQPIEYGENPAAWMLNACMKKDYKTNWKDQFLQSEQYRAMRATISSVRGGATASEDSKRITFSSVYATSALTRQYLMIRRVTKIMMRSHSYNLARIIIAIIYSLVIGLVLLDFGDKKKSLTQDAVDGYLSTIFWALTVIGVVSINMAVPVMKQIRDVFYKHRASGMLSHNSVCTAVTLGEIPFICILSVIFSSIYYSLTGGFHAVNRFFMFFLYFSLNVGVYTYFGQAFICLVRDISTAAALVGALIGFNLFFSGLIVRPQNNVMFLIGFWTAPGRYVYEGVVTSQFHGEMQPVIATPYMPYWFSLNCTNPQTECEGTLENYVNFFFSGHFSINHQWLDISVLIFCLVLARLLLWLSLWKFNYGNT